ncbi:MAG: hypothetical protein H3Z52_08780 [archaeon]|nr:hypothetical protein [archaeon]
MIIVAFRAWFIVPSVFLVIAGFEGLVKKIVFKHDDKKSEEEEYVILKIPREECKALLKNLQEIKAMLKERVKK